MRSSIPLTRRQFLAAIANASLLAAAPAIAHAEWSEPWHERTKPLMATYVSIALQHADRELALQIIGDCFRLIDSHINVLSSWKEDSCVSKLSDRRNMNGGPECLRSMLKAAEWAESLSIGRFHLFIGQLTDLWRRAKVAGGEPNNSDIQHALQLIRRTGASLSPRGIELHGHGRIDVGGIGKGIIADAACDYLASRGIRSARVACSGDLRFLGEGPWNVEVRGADEAEPRVLTIRGALAVSTSGGSENFWDVGEARYHHLIDPVSGFPGNVNRQVTVIAPTAAQSDALSSGLFFIPPSAHSRILKKTSGCSALAIDSRGEVFSA